MRREGLREIVYQERRVDEAQENPHRTSSARLRNLWKVFRQERSLEEAHENPRES